MTPSVCLHTAWTALLLLPITDTLLRAAGISIGCFGGLSSAIGYTATGGLMPESAAQHGSRHGTRSGLSQHQFSLNLGPGASWPFRTSPYGLPPCTANPDC